MPGSTKKNGRRKKRCRKFCTGLSVVRFRLARSYPTPIWPAKQIGAIYIPTKWGGMLRLHAKRLKDGSYKKLRLFYKDGDINNPPTAQEIKAGTNALVKWKRRIIYEVPRGKMGWFFVVVEGSSKAKVGNTFIQEHSLLHRPWNTWYWPGANNKNPNLYDRRVKYRGPSGMRDDGPLVKYDKYMNNSSADSARDEEWREMGRGIPPGSVGGHCDATAWAGFEETRPSGSKTVTNAMGRSVTFREQDRIGLCILRYWAGWGGENNHDGTLHNLFVRRGVHLRADWFHNKLRERIADDTGGIQVHDTRNWNYGVYKYRASFVGYGKSDVNVKKVKITTRLTFIDWGVVGSSKYRKWHGGPDRHLTTIYDLMYRNDGTIDSELSWPKKSIRGKRSKLITDVWYGNPAAPLINSKVDKIIMGSIFR